MPADCVDRAEDLLLHEWNQLAALVDKPSHEWRTVQQHRRLHASTLTGALEPAGNDPVVGHYYGQSVHDAQDEYHAVLPLEAAAIIQQTSVSCERPGASPVFLLSTALRAPRTDGVKLTRLGEISEEACAQTTEQSEWYRHCFEAGECR